MHLYLTIIYLTDSLRITSILLMLYYLLIFNDNLIQIIHTTIEIQLQRYSFLANFNWFYIYHELLGAPNVQICCWIRFQQKCTVYKTILFLVLLWWHFMTYYVVGTHEYCHLTKFHQSRTKRQKCFIISTFLLKTNSTTT